MNTIKDARKKRLIKEANLLLDQIETDLHFIFDSINTKKVKKVA